MKKIESYAKFYVYFLILSCTKMNYMCENISQMNIGKQIDENKVAVSFC